VFQDGIRLQVFQELRERDTRAFAHLLAPEAFSVAAERSGIRLGTNPLNPVHLVWLGVAAAWHRTRTFADVLGLTLKLLRDADLGPVTATPPEERPERRSPHDPRGTDPAQVTEEAFAKARKLLPWGFWVRLILVLAERFQEQHSAAVRYKGFRLLALDGTCLNLNAWSGLKAHFGTARNGAARGRTQARMVLLEFPLVRFPWRYELVPLAQGERTVAARLLDGLCRHDLVLMDRGFWSYGLFWQVQNQGAFFAVRLMAGVKPRVLRTLGPHDQLVEWTPSDRRWKRQGLPQALRLRIISYQVRGFRPSAVVTNVLDPEAITRGEWAGLATDEQSGGVLLEGLYHRRWEIETSLRELKVVQGMEGHLRGRTPEAIAYEVAGHVVLYLLIRWLLVEASEAHDAEPLRLSFTGALNELKDLSHALLTASPQRVATVLLPRLMARVAGHRVAHRPGRHYPRPHDTQVLNKGKGKRRLPSKLSPVVNQG
jgi:hypothetical protein